MSSTLLRRIILTLYVTIMVSVSALIVGYTFSESSMVQIDDREAVMRRRTVGVLTAVMVDDPAWNAVVISDQEFLLELSQQINAIPRVEGQFPGEGPWKLSGTMTFADGSREEYTLGTVLTIGQRVYYSKDLEDDIQTIRQTLAAQLYTLSNLASFFRPEAQVILSDGTSSRTLSYPEAELLGQAIEAGETVEDPEEVGQTVKGRAPRFTIQIRNSDGTGLVRLQVYANESTLVYDAYSTGQRLLLCLSGELVPLCQSLLEVP